MSKETNTLDKELIAEVVNAAMDNYMKSEESNDEQVDDILGEAELTEDETTPVEADEVDIEEVVDVDVEEAVDELVKEQLLEPGDYNFLGLDINVIEEEGQFKVTILKDEKEKVTLMDPDTIKLTTIFGLIEEFFSEIVVDEEITDEPEEDKELEEEISEAIDEAEEVEVDEDNEDEEAVTSGITMASLRLKYKDKVDEIFNHGIEAKALVLDMVKETLMAGTVKELIEKSKEKDTILASKKIDLKKETKNYLVASKLNKSLDNVYTLLSSSIKEVETDLSTGTYDVKTAKKIMDKYSKLLANTLKVEDEKSIAGIIGNINKTKAIISSYKNELMDKKKAIMESKIAQAKKVIKLDETPVAVIEQKNVINSDGWKNNTTLMAKQYRYDVIEEMSAEIKKIAGLSK